jgi:hypothetical protein
VNNVRDKLVIIAVTLIALGDMLLMAFKGFDGASIIRDVLLLLGTAYKGNQTSAIEEKKNGKESEGQGR